MNFGNTKQSIINYYHEHYPWEYYINYPETCVNKLIVSDKTIDRVLSGIDVNLRRGFLDKQYQFHRELESLSQLPPIENRTRDHITHWLTNSSIDFDDIIGVGW
uniref:Uncharacterized protein n=1 Tax=Mimiviridae sp. ChoanoV1 TaxID=2596887 RepID=A0A5B8IPM9_9VIRU|nr:hypothetical protein 1_259 [Mimiviridae sp. ChoanoV1]